MSSGHMKISEFAQVTGITRRNLLFYDEIGLLSPIMIDPHNRYRYYQYQQIDIANIITVLREIGMPLKEIKGYLTQRTPQELVKMMNEQKKMVQEKINTLIQVNDMLDTRIDMAKKGIDVNRNIDAIVLRECEAAPIFLGQKLSEDSPIHVLNGWYYLEDFYRFCEENKVIRGLPTSMIVSQADLLQENTDRFSYCYYRPINGSNYPTNAQKPKGLYVYGWEHTEYGKRENLYTRLFSYIKQAGLKICGNAYEEFLFDEISEIDPKQYLLEISIQVTK